MCFAIHTCTALALLCSSLVFRAHFLSSDLEVPAQELKASPFLDFLGKSSLQGMPGSLCHTKCHCQKRNPHIPWKLQIFISHSAGDEKSGIPPAGCAWSSSKCETGMQGLEWWRMETPNSRVIWVGGTLNPIQPHHFPLQNLPVLPDSRGVDFVH